MVEDDISFVGNVVILGEGADHRANEMEGDGTGRRFRFSVVVSEHRLHSFSSLAEVVVRNLREKVVHYVGSNVVMDFVENTEITVNGGETSTHVGPFGTTVPRDFLFRVRRSMVMEVGDGIEPHDEYPVREDIELKHSDRAKFLKVFSGVGVQDSSFST